MNQRSRLVCGGLGFTLLAATALFSPEVAVGQGKATVYQSPQAVFEALKKAAQKKDTAAYLRCLDDDLVELIGAKYTYHVLFNAGMARIAAGKNEEAQKTAEAEGKKLTDLLAKHGLTPEAMKKAGHRLIWAVLKVFRLTLSAPSFVAGDGLFGVNGYYNCR